MKQALILIFVIIAASLLIVSTAHGWLWSMENSSVRPAMVAGRFYPANPVQLRIMMDGLLEGADARQVEGTPFAIIVPHANPEFSGHVAAPAYSLIKGRKYKRVVVIGPSHVVAFPFSSVYNGDAYETSLGQIPVDKDFAERLARESPLIKLSDRGHNAVRGQAEHSVEIELPFLQVALGDFKLVPIVMGDQNYEVERALGVALAKLIKTEGDKHEPDTLIVASTDLSHFYTHEQAKAKDKKVMDAIADGDYFSLSVNFENRIWEACGGGPIVSAMLAAQRLGAKDSVVLKCADSGDVTGDKTRVVGYGAAVLARSAAGTEKEQLAFSISDEDKKTLLALAKDSVERMVLRKKPPEIPSGISDALKIARGVFVTLHKNGRLRGCIGFITPKEPLAEAVRDVAMFSASKDDRFSPVKADELADLEYEISVLSPLHRIEGLQDIVIGRDGLVLRKGEEQGLLLPQVATEYGWNAQEFAEQTAKKAGLFANEWKDDSADLFAFSAIVFGAGP